LDPLRGAGAGAPPGAVAAVHGVNRPVLGQVRFFGRNRDRTSFGQVSRDVGAGLAGVRAGMRGEGVADGSVPLATRPHLVVGASPRPEQPAVESVSTRGRLPAGDGAAPDLGAFVVVTEGTELPQQHGSAVEVGESVV